ncbi:ABC transporter substrate-binding protein [Ottowia testudinis]|uniref:ABC transporter substrate-binding protein n=1 Tax=Ottowia testudinis TaxID=2816950 RepID=A0A975CJI9_9BURK|nr:ABC transporter substrate-binding protein [Ottowia testudinis]QTD45344.1 ABC transporter substrate-binding protein [Ottowia testudinis]
MKRSARNPGFIAGTVLLAAAALLGDPAQAQSPGPARAAVSQTIRIGVVGPLTGGSADFGVPMVNGMQQAIEEINAFGGYVGRRFELVVKDDKGKEDEAVTVTKELLQKDQVVAALGFCNTGNAMKAIELFQAAKVPLIVPCATGPGITGKYPPAESYIFRSSMNDAIQLPFLVKDLIKRGLTKVAIFADNTGFGEAGLKEATKVLAEHDMKAVSVARFPLGTKDMKAQLTEARTAGANAIMTFTVGPENAAIAIGKKELGWSAPQVGGWALSFPFFINTAKDAAEGALMTQTFIAAPGLPRRERFLADYRKKFNTDRIPVPMAAAQGYDSIYLMIYALFAIKDQQITGPALKAALESGKARVHYGAVATYERPFSPESKDAVTENMLVIGTVKNGAVTFAYPEDARLSLSMQRKR